MKKGFLFILFALILGKTVSAFDGFGGWGNGFYFSNWLQSPWVIFAIIFIISFALLYYTLSNAMRGHKGPAAVISVILSLILATTLSQGGYLTGYFGEEMGGIVTLVALLLVIGLLLKAFSRIFGVLGAAAFLIFIWILLGRIDPYEFFPYQVTSPLFVGIYETAASSTGLLVVIVFIVLMTLVRTLADTGDSSFLKKMRKAFFGYSGKDKKIQISVPKG